MEYRKWYEKEINTSLLGFGAMRLATIDGEIDKELGFKLFDEAYKNGVNYFDTAFPYTNKKNETFVGEALKRYPRDSFYLATKLSLIPISCSSTAGYSICFTAFETSPLTFQAIPKALESFANLFISIPLSSLTSHVGIV